MVSVIDKSHADLARSSLEETIQKIQKTTPTETAPAIALTDTTESNKARELAKIEFKSKIPEILLKLGVGAVDINSLRMGPTVYFTGRRISMQYPNDSVVCTLAFGPHRDSQVPLGHAVPHLESGWGCCWAGSQWVEWNGSGGGIGVLITVPIINQAQTAGSA